MNQKIIYILIGLLVSINAFGQDIHVVSETWPPYNYEKDGKIVGMSTEIVRMVFKEANVKIKNKKIDLYPWSRSYRFALEDKNTMIYTIVKTKEREKLFKWVCSIVPPTKFYLFKRSDRKDIVLKNIGDAKKFLVGYQIKTVHEYFLKEHRFPKEKIEGVQRQELNIKKLDVGRIDLLIEAEHALKEMSAKDSSVRFKEFEKALFVFDTQSCMAFSRSTSDKIVKNVRKAFHKLQKRGDFQEIIKKYSLKKEKK